MTPLEKLIREEIAAKGPMDFGTFMARCLYDPQYGYYITHDPVGKDGDFITSPEISQIFGEMIALWCMDTWMKMGSPSSFNLLECGPGHGTLMQDVLRGAKAVPNFLSAASICLLEISPVLKARQQQALANDKVNWISDIRDLPDQPTIMFCNEFFDAFPVERMVRTPSGMKPQKIVLEDGKLKLEHEGLPAQESSPAIQQWLNAFFPFIVRNGGAALIVDYAHDGMRVIDSVQAMRKHGHDGLLAAPGEADITAYVDYGAITARAAEYGLTVHAVLSQRDFLLRYGLEQRLQQLKQRAKPEQIKELESGAARLIDANGMGKLFRVLCLTHGSLPAPHGF
jgi:NADH dehydrogenase [ubiquinone] 1 alpha subcomplex assembly factor 7